MSKNFDHLKSEFVIFLANPERDITQGDWAKEHDMNETVLSHWKKQGWFKEALVKEVESVLGDDLAPIYKALRKRALSGDISAINLYLKQAELLKADKSEVLAKINLDPFRDLIEVTTKEVDEERQKQIEEVKGDAGSVAKEVS